MVLNVLKTNYTKTKAAGKKQKYCNIKNYNKKLPGNQRVVTYSWWTKLLSKTILQKYWTNNLVDVF